MASAMPEFVDASPFADADLWKLGFEKNWEELKRILARVTDKKFAVTELEHRLLIDNIRQRIDSLKEEFGSSMLAIILLSQKKKKRPTSPSWS
jgi:hypothetical protein